MKNKQMKINLSIKTLVFISVVFMFSSCMLMSPTHLAGDHGHSDQGNSFTEARDIVCGNSVSPQNSLSYQYNNNTYYFHTEKCLNDFRQAPESYINNQSDHHRNRRGNGMMWGLGAIGAAALMAIMFL